MAKQCNHCGKVLPNDSIRYCPGCGKSVASSRPAKKSISQNPPAWMKQLENSLTSNRSNLPLRELNVTVWEEEETRNLVSPESGNDEVQADLQVADGLPTSPLLVASSPRVNVPSQVESSLPGVDVGKQDGAEDLPTNPYMATMPQNAPLSQPGFNIANGSLSHDQIEEIETRPYVAQSRNISQGIEKPVQYQQRQAMQTPPGITNAPAMQRPVTPIPLAAPKSQSPPFEPVRQTPPGSMPVPPLTKAKRTLVNVLPLCLDSLSSYFLAG